MKRMLATALAFAAMASVATAQDMEQQNEATMIKPLRLPAQERVSYPKDQGMTGRAVESEYFWNSGIYRRVGPDGDSNRRDVTVPLSLGGTPETVMRGFGQIFAPRSLFSVYSPSIYNENTSYVSNVDNRFENDQEYIDQFKGAQNFTLQAVSFPFYDNPRAQAQNPGLVSFLKSTVNFAGSTFRSSGLNIGRSKLPVARRITIDQEALDTTTRITDFGDTVIAYTIFEFLGDPGAEDGPIEFAANESLILLYTNEFSTPVTQPIPANDGREWQRAIAFDEYAGGGFVEDPNNPGQFLDQRTGPAPAGKTFGVVMYRVNEIDSIYTARHALTFGDNPALVNLNTSFFGTVELSVGGVRYHFGRDASSQGIGAVTPNPVREKAYIPFSLTERASVKLDLFDMSGRLVRSLADASYIPGEYSVDLRTEGLVNGAYVLRMTAGEKVYTQKLNISR